MKTRKLGALEVSAIGMGCMGMSHAAGTPMNTDDAVQVVREAAETMGGLFTVDPCELNYEQCVAIYRKSYR